jgi:IS605 OrfB family transposase
MSEIERKLFAEYAKGTSIQSLKSSYLKRFSITARQFNAIRVQLEGKISSIKELQKIHVKDLDRRISSLKTSIEKNRTKKRYSDFSLHHKKRRLSALRLRRASLQNDIDNDIVPLCFGSKKLFRKQYDLSANGYQNHDGWKKEWQSERSKSFFILGSKDETNGNQSATLSLQQDGRLSLRLRIPDALSGFGKHLVINDLYFPYGQEQILEGLRRCQARKKDGESGVAISCRFVRDEKGWQLFVSLPVQKPKIITRKGIGVIGIDINADHLAIAETDRFGNPIYRRRFDLSTYGKTQSQAKALIGDVVKEIADLSVKTQKPLVIENLSLEKKKSELREIGNPRYARMLSSFFYGAVISGVKSRAFRLGVEVDEVNPAFTSIIGRAKFSKRYGLSIHESAALCIGRRFLGVSERIPRRLDEIADGKGGYVASPVPVRNRGEHVWSSWRRILKRLPAVLAAQNRARRTRSAGRRQPSCCDIKKVLDLVGEIPARESTAELLGCRV